MKLRIGGLALAAGVTPHTIRYYEKLNLLPRANRTYGGYRLYTEEDVKRLVFIKHAQKMGFSLVEIKRLLFASGSGLEECSQIQCLLSSKLVQIDKWLAEMQAFREAVANYLHECEETLEGKRGDCCPVLSELTQATSAVRESEVISLVNDRKSSATKHKEKCRVDRSTNGRAGQHRGAGNYCDPLLLGNGLVR